LKAAQELVANKRWRSIVSRSYYAAYSAVTGALEGRANYPRGMKNPPHDDVPNLVRNNLTTLSIVQRRRIGTIMVRLYASRLDADYRPKRTLDRSTAASATIGAADVMRILGVLK